MKKALAFFSVFIFLFSCRNNSQNNSADDKASFTVRYAANLDGAMGQVEDQQHLSGFAIALRNADYKKLMYDFTGWYTEPGVDSEGAGEVFAAGKDAVVPNPNKKDVVTLYAGWKNRGGYNRSELKEIPLDTTTTKAQTVKIVDPDWKNQSGATLEVIAQDLENVKSPLTLDLSEIAVENLSELFTKDNVDRVAFGDENARYDAEGNVAVSGKDAKPINIERVVIPATLENFSSNLFANCMAVKEFVVPEENEWFCTNNSTNGGRGEKGAGHILYQKMKINSGGVTSPDSRRLVAVAVATSFTGDLELDANTVQIGHQAAYGCQGLKSVNWSSLQKLERIGMYSFMKCTGLKSVTVPKNVTSIDGYTFTGCYNIGTLDFEPNSKLYYIGSRAFQTETKVNDVTKNEFSGKTINLPASLTKLGGQVFGNMYNKMTINFSNEGTGTWYYFVTSEKSFLESGVNANGWNNTSADKADGIIDQLIAGVTDTNGSIVFKATEVGSDMTTGYKSKDTLTLLNGSGYDEPKECSLGGHVECNWFRK